VDAGKDERKNRWNRSFESQAKDFGFAGVEGSDARFILIGLRSEEKVRLWSKVEPTRASIHQGGKSGKDRDLNLGWCLYRAIPAFFGKHRVSKKNKRNRPRGGNLKRELATKLQSTGSSGKANTGGSAA